MRFLGVDTSSSRTSVAIADNGQIVTEAFYTAEAGASSNGVLSRNNHSEILLSLIDSTLTTSGWSLADLSGFAVAIGPGSFTGLRIGLSTVKGLAYGTGTPVVGISTLHALAARINDFDGYICAILGARKTEIYAALFRRHQGLLERVTADDAMSVEQLVDIFHHVRGSDSILLTGDGVAPFREPLICALGARMCSEEKETLPTIAGAVALLAEAKFTAGPVASVPALTPLYMRWAQTNAKMRMLA